MKKTLQNKLFIIALTVAMILSQGTISNATTIDNIDLPVVTENDLNELSESYETLGLLRYQYVTIVTPSLSISGGRGYCTSTVVMGSAKEIHVNVALQRSTDGINFSNVASWSNDFSNVGSNVVTGDASVTSGYYYRNETTVIVRSGQTVLETIYAQSAIRYY